MSKNNWLEDTGTVTHVLVVLVMIFCLVMIGLINTGVIT